MEIHVNFAKCLFQFFCLLKHFHAHQKNDVIKKSILVFVFLDFTGNNSTLLLANAKQLLLKMQLMQSAFFGTHCKAPNSIIA
jgi:hypothetical protein